MTVSAPAGVAAQIAASQQSIALSVIKANANAEQAAATLLEQAVKSVPESGRGQSVDISA